MVLKVLFFLWMFSYGGEAFSATGKIYNLNRDWYYRYGVSPADTNGIPEFAKSVYEVSPDWEKTDTLMNINIPLHRRVWMLFDEIRDGFINGRRESPFLLKREKTLWLKTQIPNDTIVAPAIFIHSIYFGARVYYNHRLIYQCGEMHEDLPPSFTDKFQYKLWHIIRLPETFYRDTNRLLAIEVFSRHEDIGIVDSVYVGSMDLIIRDIIMKSIIPFGFGMFYILCGVFGIIIFFFKPKQTIFLHFGLLAVSLGVNSISLSQIKQIWIDNPVFWQIVDILSASFSLISLLWFMMHLFKTGYEKLFKALSWIDIIYVVIVLALNTLTDIKTYKSLSVMIALNTTFVLFVLFQLAMKGDKDARIVLLGFGLLGGSASLIIIRVFGIFGSIEIVSWGIMLFMMSLGAIILRRYFQYEHSVAIYSTSLEETINELKKSKEQLELYNKDLEEKVAQHLQISRQNDMILIKKNRLATMGEMMHNIAHHWRNPLGAIALCVQNLEDRCNHNMMNEEILHKSVQKIMRIIGHLTKTIDEFRDFFKPDGQKITFSIADAVSKTLHLISEDYADANIEIVNRIQTDVMVLGYPAQYAQVVLDILGNAKEMLLLKNIQNATITIELETQISGRPYKSCLKITDNAGGIPEDIMDKIFDPYFTTKENGTGIGLYMCQIQIEINMGGWLSVKNVETEFGKGAQFSIEL